MSFISIHSSFFLYSALRSEKRQTRILTTRLDQQFWCHLESKLGNRSVFFHVEYWTAVITVRLVSGIR